VRHNPARGLRAAASERSYWRDISVAGALLCSAVIAGACQSGSVAEINQPAGSASVANAAAAAVLPAAQKTAAPAPSPAASGAEPQRGPEDSPPPAADMALIRAPHLSAPTGIESTPLFGCSVANFAWGAVLRGFVIDTAGRVWSFDHGKIWNAKLAPDAGSPSAPGGAWFERAALSSLYSPAESDARLPLPIIAKYQALIAPAQLGKITRAQWAVDAGGYGCDAYSWNATGDAYQPVELGARGDVNVLNDAPAAHALSAWLHGVEHVLGLPPFAKPASIQRRPRRVPPHR